jgi:protein-export membrane protein SecD
MTLRNKMRLHILGVVLLAFFVGIVVYPKAVSFVPPLSQSLERLQIALGLDLQGGVHLEYQADVSGIADDQRDDALSAVQAVIERRVNAFGVGEPVVQIAQSGEEYRIIVEIPGVKDVEEAKDVIKETPTLEFREEYPEGDTTVEDTLSELNNPSQERARETLERAMNGEDFSELAKELSQDPGSKENGGDLDFVKRGEFVPEFDEVLFNEENPVGQVYPELVESDFGWHIIKIEERRGEGDEREVRARHILFQKITPDMVPSLQFKATELTGKYLEDASVDFGGVQGIGNPQIVLQFDSEGKEIFRELTERNVGKQLAIFIDNQLVTAPVIQEVIPGGTATITGSYTLEEAQELKSRLDEGALPLPLELVGQQSVEASLGAQDLEKSLVAGLFGLLVVVVYMVVYYRLLGVLASFSLILYSGMLISLFKFSTIPGWDWPITLTLSGIAGFILSIGMAVDANILIFERIREELRYKKRFESAVREGFKRAWTSIRDGNISTLLTALILVWIGTGFVQGFALILALGVSLSMFTAIVIVRTLLKAMPSDFIDKHLWLIIRRKK